MNVVDKGGVCSIRGLTLVLHDDREYDLTRFSKGLLFLICMHLINCN